jgi:hypothetical protein
VRRRVVCFGALLVLFSFVNRLKRIAALLGIVGLLLLCHPLSANVNAVVDEGFCR